MFRKMAIFFFKFWHLKNKYISPIGAKLPKKMLGKSGVSFFCFFSSHFSPWCEWMNLSSKHKAYINVHPVDVGYMTSLFFSSVKGGQFKKHNPCWCGCFIFQNTHFCFLFFFFFSWYPTGIYWVLQEMF